jgi:hypothetical protein
VPTPEWQVGTLDLGLGCQAKRVDNVPRLHHVQRDGCDHQGRPSLQSTREWLDAFGAERAAFAPLLASWWFTGTGERSLEVAAQARERIEEVVLAVELGNRCVNASHIGSHGNIAQ